MHIRDADGISFNLISSSCFLRDTHAPDRNASDPGISAIENRRGETCYQGRATMTIDYRIFGHLCHSDQGRQGHVTLLSC